MIFKSITVLPRMCRLGLVSNANASRMYDRIDAFLVATNKMRHTAYHKGPPEAQEAAVRAVVDAKRCAMVVGAEIGVWKALHSVGREGIGSKFSRPAILLSRL